MMCDSTQCVYHVNFIFQINVSNGMGNLLRVLSPNRDDNSLAKVDIFVDFESKYYFFLWSLNFAFNQHKPKDFTCKYELNWRQ